MVTQTAFYRYQVYFNGKASFVYHSARRSRHLHPPSNITFGRRLLFRSNFGAKEQMEEAGRKTIQSQVANMISNSTGNQPD
jgi:hypothetical protein